MVLFVVCRPAAVPVSDLALLSVSAQTTAGFSTVPVDGLPRAAKAVRVFLFVAREQDEGTVAELDLPAGARVSHVYREDALVLADPDLALRKGDEVVIVTHRKHVEDLRSRWETKAG